MVQVVPRTPLLEVRYTTTDGRTAAARANDYAATILAQSTAQGWLVGRQISLVENASAPTGASNDKLLLDVALATVAGGALAFGVVYLVNAFRLRRQAETSS